MPKTILKATEISKDFSETQCVLKNISFTVQKGESLVILGQSGVGKTVLLKILAGLIPPTQGSVQKETQNIGMLFQSNALFDSFTVAENLDFPLKERTSLDKKARDEKVKLFLSYVGLSGTEEKAPTELSGGMQKRLAIARTLIVEPELVLYDEPTAGLDPVTSRNIIDLIVELKNKLGSTLVSVTSDVLRAFQLGDTIALLKKSSGGATFTSYGSPEVVKKSSDIAIQQFITGNTKQLGHV